MVLALRVDHLFRVRVAALWGAGVPEPSLRLREVTKLGSGGDRARVHSGRQAASSGSKAFQGSVRQQHPVPLHGVGVRPPGAGALSCP